MPITKNSKPTNLRFGKAYGEQSCNNQPLHGATHTGNRVSTRGRCEKCKTPTNWTVNVMGRDAFWCGCGN